MKTKAFSLLFVFFCLALRAVAENREFQTFANHQHQLMNDAYEKKNIKLYGQLLTEFMSKYNQLSADDKKTYQGYLTDGYYNYSCTYSLLNQHKEAIYYLNKAIKAGYLDYMHIQSDTDLDNIRNDADFTVLVQPLRKVSDYMYIIQHAGAYNTADNRNMPVFTYQSADNPNLVILRKRFNLDSVAGKGNDVSQVLNLMYWIHNLIPHDGNHENPAVKNALSMITECKRDNRGLNCRGLATVLNECYLSMGYKSRFVTCLPKDSLGIDNDCHVINMVFIPSLKKWIWVDPTFAAYVRDEKGQLLNLGEVRERLVNNNPLILNPEANWNHKATETKEQYLYNYMAKNLYMLECPVNSEYDIETKMPGKTITYVQLLPLEYYKQGTNNKSTSVNNNTKVTFVKYATNNPDAFWAAPAK